MPPPTTVMFRGREARRFLEGNVSDRFLEFRERGSESGGEGDFGPWNVRDSGHSCSLEEDCHAPCSLAMALASLREINVQPTVTCRRLSWRILSCQLDLYPFPCFSLL